MLDYGTTREQMALVREKTTYDSYNPYAQFTKRFGVDAVMSSKVVAPPLCLFDCCGMTDGAAAVILAADEIAKKLTDTPVWILGGTQCVFAADTVNQMGNLSEWPALRRAAKELHDCFTISEIIEYEELGFCKKGEGGSLSRMDAVTSAAMSP
ncbi:MAG: Acetyl-CoA acetyltransferase [Candidatus Alkanophagales archaeon MCA70_species_1]|nr:Acetyl-CoA acetyltransferase [Candidatus Alkanophaga volatiphilum]